MIIQNIFSKKIVNMTYQQQNKVYKGCIIRGITKFKLLEKINDDIGAQKIAKPT